MTARQGRGRPPLFDDTARERFLGLVAGGLGLGDAAQACPVPRTVVTYTKLHHPDFAAALTAARAKGRQVRRDDSAHGESRYNHQGCRCDICKKEATAARTGRRTTAAPDQTGVLVMPQQAEPARPLVLAVAS